MKTQQADIINLNAKGKTLLAITVGSLSLALFLVIFLTIKINNYQNQSKELHQQISNLMTISTEQKQSTQNLKSHLSELDFSLKKKLSTAIEEIQPKLEEKTEEIADLTESTTNINNKLLEIDTSIKKMHDKPSPLTDLKQKFDLAIIAKIIKLADFNLNFLQDTTNCEQLLNFAEQWINLQKNEELSPLIESIQQDKLMLQKLEITNKRDIWHTLDSLAQHNYYYHNNNITSTPTHVSHPEQTPPDTTEHTWQYLPKKLWRQFTKDIKIIDHRNNTAKLDLLSRQNKKEFYQDYLKLLFEEIKLATLSNDNELYQASISQTKQLLSKYFNNEDALTIQALTELARLADIDIKSTLAITMNSVVYLQFLQRLS